MLKKIILFCTSLASLHACKAPSHCTAAMYLAINSSDDQSFLAMLKQNPDLINATHGINNKTALIWATSRNKIPYVKLLIAFGAILEARDIDGKTALMHAADQPAIESAILLVESGAEIDTISHKGDTALSIAHKNYQKPPKKKQAGDFKRIADYLHEQLSLQIMTARSVLTANCLLLSDLATLIIAYRFADQDMLAIHNQTNAAITISNQLAGKRTKKKKSQELPAALQASLKKHKTTPS